MVTPEILIEHGITAPASGALGLLIADAEADITARYGPRLTPLVEEYIVDVGQNTIWLKREIYSITSVQHGSSFKASDLSTLTADADDGFMIIGNKRAITKLGGNFGRSVRVTYDPLPDDDRRDRVIIDLCKLSARANNNGAAVSSKSVGDLSLSYGGLGGGGSSNDYNQEREKIMSALAAGQRTFA